MKKLLLALALVICLAATTVALTACGGTDECDHIWATKATVDTVATCTTEGSESIKCLDCGAKKADSVTSIPATGHNYATGDYTAPTCTDAGSETKVCATCNDTVTTAIPATGEHVWNSVATNDVEPDCENPGERSIKCIYCREIKPGSVEVVPAGHIWSTIHTADKLPTCTESGIKTVKCLHCGEMQQGTEVILPATGHTGLSVVVKPTFFSEGLAEGVCIDCEENCTEVLPKTEAQEYLFTASTGDKFYTQLNINEDILDGDHFYPTEENPNGKDLYVEFSFLYNPTLHNYNNGVGNHYLYFGMLADARVTEKRRTAYHLLIRESPDADFWCTHIGGFEPHYNGDKVTYGPSMRDDGEVTDFPNIGEYGWHRIGLHYHQTTRKENGKAKHSIEVALYIDGVKVSAYYTVKDENNDYLNLLYTAKYEGDKIVYGDSSDDAFLYPYLIGDARALANTEMYFIVADLYVSAGDGFVLDVLPVEDPEDKTYSPKDGVEFSGNVYFKLADAE